MSSLKNSIVLTINGLKDNFLRVTFGAAFIYDYGEQSWPLNYKRTYFHLPWFLFPLTTVDL